ncbi:UDP-N-acetylmuramoyl-L-alanine--D-glutamate ligase [soil metagenome]
MPSRPPRPPLPAGPYLVVGLARSGQAVARYLADAGERVIACDSGSPEGAERLRDLGVEVRLDGDWSELADDAACVVKSPGVPRESPVIAHALDAGVTVIGELEFAWRLLPNPFVAVTGTNGKTTVVELLGHIWRSADRPVEVAGNVGTALTTLVGKVDADATVVCECSSFQLEDSIEFAPDCAVLLNVAPDHLDRHGSFEHYRDSKLKIFANQRPGQWAILDSAEPGLAGARPGGRGKILDLAGAPLPGLPEGSALAGPHNARNARAAASAAMAMGIPRTQAEEALATFPGLPHRLERIGETGGVAYVNDSKATNAPAALAAIESFEQIRLIAGGALKGERFTELAAAVAEHCVAVYLTGPAAEPLAEDLAPAASAGIELKRCDSFDQAFAAAAADAQPGGTVLLSPACTSFDEFSDYEERGERFRSLVAAL